MYHIDGVYVYEPQFEREASIDGGLVWYDAS